MAAALPPVTIEPQADGSYHFRFDNGLVLSIRNNALSVHIQTITIPETSAHISQEGRVVGDITGMSFDAYPIARDCGFLSPTIEFTRQIDFRQETFSLEYRFLAGGVASPAVLTQDKQVFCHAGALFLDSNLERINRAVIHGPFFLNRDIGRSALTWLGVIDLPAAEREPHL